MSINYGGITLLVLSVVLPCVEGQYRSSIASALLLCVKKGIQQGMFPGVTELNKAMLFGYGGGTEIQELSMTCLAQGRPRATTAVDDR